MPRVKVFKRSGRDHYEMQWKDPVSWKVKTRTTGTKIRREADRMAAKLEVELDNGGFQGDSPTTWAEFRERYEAEAFLGKSPNTVRKDRAALQKIEDLIAPKYLTSVTPNAIGQYRRKLYAEGLAGFTIRGHLAALRRFLRWAKRNHLIAAIPEIDLPTKVTRTRGRAITAEEFERMLAKTASVVGEDAAESWLFLLQGLWLSGLRLSEAMKLHWTDDRNLCVDLSGKRPMFRIRGHAEKGRKDRVLPMAPEFAELLDEVPKRQRRGFVFDPRPQRKPFDVRLLDDWVSRAIGRIGAVAGIKVSETDGRVKYASAHDLRRSFGVRWSQRVLPPVLMELMRHESITTTQEFYVGRNAEVAAETIWAAYDARPANISANIDETTGFAPKQKTT